MRTESTTIAAIVAVAERHGWHAVRMRGGPMQRAGIPAVLCLKEGKAVWFNVRRPGQGKKSEPTPAQARRIEAIRRQGGSLVFCVTGPAEADMALSNIGAFVRPDLRRKATDPGAARCERRSVCRRCPL